MQKSNIASFMDLILFDQSLIEYENQLDILYEDMGKLEKQKNIQSNLFIQKQSDHALIKKNIKKCEKDLADAIEQEKKINQTHKDVHDKKEYAALKKEIDHCHTIQQAIEKKLLLALDQSDHLEKECNLLLQDKEQESQGADSLISECKQKITALEETFEKAKEKRNGFKSNISPEWLVHYERMRQEVSDPLAFVVEESCSSCFQILTPYELMQIRKGPLTCKGCYRFLCIRPE